MFTEPSSGVYDSEVTKVPCVQAELALFPKMVTGRVLDDSPTCNAVLVPGNGAGTWRIC